MHKVPQYDERMFQEFYKLYQEKLCYTKLIGKTSEEDYVRLLAEVMFIGWHYGKLQTLESILDKTLGDAETALKELLKYD